MGKLTNSAISPIQIELDALQPMRIKILARKKLNMSPGKIAAQSVHAALALAVIDARVDPMMSVVVLSVNEGKFNEAKKGIHAVIRDAGFTEVAPGTETVVAFLEEDPREPAPFTGEALALLHRAAEMVRNGPDVVQE